MHAAVTKISKISHITNEKRVLLKYANPSLHRFEAAQKSLEENLVLKLIDRVEGDDIGDRNYLFKDLVLELWQVIEYIAEMNVEQDSVPGETVGATMRERIRGWEFMDLVQDTQVLQPKEVMIDKTNGGWADLAGESEILVLFASGFGDLIKPASMTSGLCRTWKTVPTNKDYLASGVPILQMLLERTGPNKDQGYITNSGLKWDYTPTTMFEACKGLQGSPCTRVHLQRFFHDSTTICRTKSPRQLSEEGAVIFGKDGLSSHAKSSIYSQPNLPWELEKKPTFLHVDTSNHESRNSG